VDVAALRTFVAVAETGQFQAAADELGISQQAVSKRIATLEKHLEVPLLVRTSRGSRPSLDGQVFLPHAKKILTTIEQAEQAVRPGNRPLRIDVLNRRIAAAQAVYRFYRSQPEMGLDAVTLSNENATQACQAVLDGTIDQQDRGSRRDIEHGHLLQIRQRCGTLFSAFADRAGSCRPSHRRQHYWPTHPAPPDPSSPNGSATSPPGSTGNAKATPNSSTTTTGPPYAAPPSSSKPDSPTAKSPPPPASAPTPPPAGNQSPSPPAATPAKSATDSTSSESQNNPENPVNATEYSRRDANRPAPQPAIQRESPGRAILIYWVPRQEHAPDGTASLPGP